MSRKTVSYMQMIQINVSFWFNWNNDVNNFLFPPSQFTYFPLQSQRADGIWSSRTDWENNLPIYSLQWSTMDEICSY